MRKTNPRGPGPSREDWDLLKAKLQLANDGDPDAIEWLRQFLDRNPQVWQQLGDLARGAERAWILLISNGNALVAETIERKLTSLRQELSGDTPTVIERLLGDTILATWLEVRHLEAESASPHAGGGSRTQVGLLLKRLESAQKRHIAAIRSLVQIQKLLPQGSTVPPLRIFTENRATG